MYKKKYGSYQKYLDDQINGRRDLKKMKDCVLLRNERVQAFNDMLKSLNASEVSSYLCIGARFGEEVEAGLAYFSKCVGIDLLSYPPLVVKGDMHNLQFADESFDVIYINVLDHAYNIKKVLDEIDRVLKSKGFLIVDATFIKRDKPKLNHYSSIDLEDSREIIDLCRFKMLRHEKITNEILVKFGLLDRLIFQKQTF